MQDSGHIAIAGAGIIGLACALALKNRGFQVTVLEAATAMKEASWAAGGMLAVLDPENPPALLPLSHFSRNLYESFLAEIGRLSGQPIPLRTFETVQVREVGPMLERAAVEPTGISLTRDTALELIPGLGSANHNYTLLEEASLNPRDLCTALPVATRAAGITIRENERVLTVEDEGDDVLLLTEKGRLRANAFLNCCGAWTSTFDASAGVAPRKGQMLVIAQADGARLTRVLRSPDVYLIPRGDGRIVIGATVEDVGYSKEIDASALMSLRERAAALWPPAMDAPLVESWAGLRPGSADGLPTIGRYDAPGAPRFVAAGHHRNGILLAPGTAHMIADLVGGVSPAIDLSLFAPHRLSPPAACDKHFAAAL